MTKKKNNPNYVPEPTPIPAPVVRPIEQIVVPVEPPKDQPVFHNTPTIICTTSPCLNCRYEPSMTSWVACLIDRGYIGKVIDTATCNDGYLWYHLEDKGWVRSEFTEPVE